MLTKKVLSVLHVMLLIYSISISQVVEVTPELNSCFNCLENIHKAFNKDMDVAVPDSIFHCLNSSIAYLESKNFAEKDSVLAFANLMLANQQLIEYKLEQAIATLQVAEKWARNGPPSEGLADIYDMRCIAYELKGEAHSAVSFGLAAQQLFASLADTIGWARSTANLAKAYIGANFYPQALRYLRRSIQLYSSQALSIRDSVDYFALFNMLGQVHTVMANEAKVMHLNKEATRGYQAAIDTFQFLLKHSKFFGENGLIYLAIIRFQLGQAYLESGSDENIRLALEHFAWSEKAFNTIFQGQPHPQLGMVRVLYGLALCRVRDFEHGFASMQDGLRILGYEASDLFENANLRMADLRAKKFLFIGLSHRISALMAYLNQYPTERSDLLPKIYEAALHPLAILDSMRLGSTSDIDLQALGAKASPMYFTAAELALDLGDEEAAFRHSEQARSLLLRQAAARLVAQKEGTGRRAQLVAQDLYLRQQLAQYEHRYQFTGPDEVTLMLDSLDVAKERLAAYIRSLADSPPGSVERRYFFERYVSTTIQSSNVQQQLDDSTAVISYLAGSDAIIVFVITAKNFFVKKIVYPSDWENCVALLGDALRFDLTAQEFPTDCALDFYRRLIEKPLGMLPNSGTIRHLVIVPDNQLRELSFDLLLTGRVRPSTPYCDFPFLIDSFSYNISYSLEADFLLSKIHTEKSASAFRTGIFVADYTAKKDTQTSAGMGIDSESSYFEPLPYLEKSAWRIATLTNADLFFPATLNAFQDSARLYQSLLLIMHGYALGVDPLEYRLVFGPGENLKVADIYNLPDFQPELVVFGSCQTEDGLLLRGEGIISIARAFAVAGCRSSVATLNNVLDRDAAPLLELFFERLATGTRKDMALAIAKRIYRNNLSPRRWANFVCIGASGSLQN